MLQEGVTVKRLRDEKLMRDRNRVCGAFAGQPGFRLGHGAETYASDTESPDGSRATTAGLRSPTGHEWSADDARFVHVHHA